MDILKLQNQKKYLKEIKNTIKRKTYDNTKPTTKQ